MHHKTLSVLVAFVFAFASWIAMCGQTAVAQRSAHLDGVPSPDSNEKQGAELTPRDLFYEGLNGGETQRSAAPMPKQAEANAMTMRAAPAALSVRYNVLLKDGDKEVAVNPTKGFKTNDCIVLVLEANRAGYLHIVAEGTSGEWVPLFPAPNSAVTTNQVKAHEQVRAPAKSCFEFLGQHGTERLFIIMTNEDIDVKDILQTFRLSSVATIPSTSKNTVEEEIAQLGTRFRSRDIRVRAEEEPRYADERPHMVYAAAPHDRIFLEVRLDHK